MLGDLCSLASLARLGLHGVGRNIWESLFRIAAREGDGGGGFQCLGTLWPREDHAWAQSGLGQIVLGHDFPRADRA